jgi:hypothetical protein
MFWAEEFAVDQPEMITRSVGWLGDFLPSTGRLELEPLTALEHFATWARVEDFFLGMHVCELCRNEESHGEFWILCQNTRYVLPQMTLHYVAVHCYLPPAVFLRDLLKAWHDRPPASVEFPYGIEAQKRKLDAAHRNPRARC